MANTLESGLSDWTAADLVARFGAIPLHRLRWTPTPGMAAESDVIEIRDREDRLFELADGILVEKTVGTYESYLAGLLVRLLGGFVSERGLGIVLPPDGIMRLAPGLVRIPDVSFLSWDRLPGHAIPDEPLWNVSPDLAVEIVSKGNTAEEMQRKLYDYFAAGTRQVWYFYPANRQALVYTSPDVVTIFDDRQTLTGGDLLPGFVLPLEPFFTPPSRPDQT